LPTQIGERAGIVKRVAFSCKIEFIPQVFHATLPESTRSPDPHHGSGSSRPIRVRNIPDRLGISRDPSVSRLGGEL
jgi:hypothetical protein